MEPFGGTVPGDASVLEMVHVKKFLESRCLEIEELMSTLKQTEKQDRIFQRLPFVLRRRATSHNPFRVPKRLRLHLAREMSRSMPKCAKRLRKDARHRLNRLEEYRRRCERNQWLETHLYHAKRFKMATLWGYRVAYSTTQKCRRRCMRYCKRRCVIHDLSYVSAITVRGTLPTLRTCFRAIFADSSLMFQDRLLSGEYRSEAYAYVSTDTGCRMICPTRFIWIAPQATQVESGSNVKMAHATDKTIDDTSREIWFFVHPAAISEFMDTLRQTNIEIDCCIKDLSTFEVMGPLSTLLLRGTLKVNASLSGGNSLWNFLDPCNIDIPPSYILPLRVDAPIIYGNTRPGFKLESMRNQHRKTAAFNSNCVSIEDRLSLPTFKAPENFEVVTKVNIPRLRRRNYAQQVAKLLGYLNVGESATTGTNQSRQPQNAKMDDDKAASESDHSSYIAQSDNKPDGSVPIWLIRRGDSLGGFDLVMPRGTIARKLWILLNRYGGMGIGLKEREMIYAQHGQCSFPQDYPDTIAGQHHLEALEAKLTKRFFSTPANKRPNYRYMGVDRPFHFPRFTTITAAHSVGSTAGDTSTTTEGHLAYHHTEISGTQFRSHIPGKWIPHSYIGRTNGDYMRSRHLLLSCVTAGLHCVYPELDTLPILRITRVPCTSNRYLQQLLDRYMSSSSPGDISMDDLSLSCVVEMPGRGSLSTGDRIYLPSLNDLSTNKNFISAITTGFFANTSSRWIVPGSKPSTSHSRNVPHEVHLTEPGHDEYKLRNLKQLFGCHKSRKVAPMYALDGMRKLESYWQGPVRACIGVVTSVGFTRKGLCIIHLGAFLELLRLIFGLCGFTGTMPSLDRIRLFVWLRSNQSRDYMPGVVSIAIDDGIGLSA
ncbi:RNase P subunit [Babesia ovis]|uniref:RNase P subunit n=1 Tax=Babesia ovis TaxID=5869 RepID=A0A9W5WTY5_BABOV|nr:RNase P subunit [Babesia ovis]